MFADATGLVCRVARNTGDCSQKRLAAAVAAANTFVVAVTTATIIAAYCVFAAALTKKCCNSRFWQQRALSYFESDGVYRARCLAFTSTA